MKERKNERNRVLLQLFAICQREEEENCSFFSWIGILFLVVFRSVNEVCHGVGGA
jgi:hypothetical protein